MKNFACLVHFLPCQCGVHQKHQAGFTKLPGERQPRRWPRSIAVKGFFHVDLRACPLKTRNSPRVDFAQNPIAAPSGSQATLLDIHVALVIAMHASAFFCALRFPATLIASKTRHADCGMRQACLPNRMCVPCSGVCPSLHPSQLDATDRSLYFQHSPIGSKRIMHPSKSLGVRSIVNGIPIFPMVFVGPHLPPQRKIICCHHPPLSSGGYDFVLAERPGPHIPDSSHASPLVAGPVGLRAILDHF